jgi:hypothetical protein
MPEKRIIQRPPVMRVIQWNGENISEIQELVSERGLTAVDNNDGTADIIQIFENVQYLQMTLNTGDWINFGASISSMSDQTKMEAFQEVPDEDPVAYVTKKDPS